MTISAKMLCDSIWDDKRIVTMELRYPRFIHAEFMTHRAFSRNASSSRAIPVERVIQDILDDTAMPIHWGKNQKGMQAREEHDAEIMIRDGHFEFPCNPRQAWLEARDNAIEVARAYADAGYHKQVVNRLLEPFSHINVVMTATDLENFFELRRHPDAQPEIHELADRMWDQMCLSAPIYRPRHLPYTTWEDENKDIVIGQGPWGEIVWSTHELISAARCARVSYRTHDGKWSEPEADIALAKSLIEDKHLSPFEHQAYAASGRHANLYGWKSVRQSL